MTKQANLTEQVERLAVNAQQAAGMLGISVRTLWTRVSDGTVPTKRLGGRVLFPIDALRGLMNVTHDQQEEER